MPHRSACHSKHAPPTVRHAPLAVHHTATPRRPMPPSSRVQLISFITATPAVTLCATNVSIVLNDAGGWCSLFCYLQLLKI